MRAIDLSAKVLIAASVAVVRHLGVGSQQRAVTLDPEGSTGESSQSRLRHQDHRDIRNEMVDVREPDLGV